MVRSFVFACLFAGALAAPVVAQDGGDPGTPSPAGGKAQKGEHHARAPMRRLDFDAPPADWKAHPADPKSRMHFQADYDLPAPEGQTEGARVTVLGTSGRPFDGYKERLLRGWTKADGSALAAADQTVEDRKTGDLEVKVLEQTGTYTSRGGEAKPGLKLVAAWVHAGSSGWSVWLMGPAAAVDAQRDAFLKWLDTARPAAAPKQADDDDDDGDEGDEDGD